MQSDLLFHEVSLFFDHGRYLEEPIRLNARLPDVGAMAPYECTCLLYPIIDCI